MTQPIPLIGVIMAGSGIPGFVGPPFPRSLYRRVRYERWLVPTASRSGGDVHDLGRIRLQESIRYRSRARWPSP